MQDSKSLQVVMPIKARFARDKVNVKNNVGVCCVGGHMAHSLVVC